MDREGALAIQRRAFRDFVELMGTSSPGARVIELDGVPGAVVPAVPDRSIANSAIYRDPAALAANYAELAAAYAEAGINAWTVWTPEFEAEAIDLLTAAGHVFDGQPAAKVLELERFEAPDAGDLDWDEEATMTELGELNDRAYDDHGAGGLAPAFTQTPPGLALRLYRARVDGELACVLGTIDHRPTAGAAGPDCGIYFVATDPDHRRQGLATRLMGVALAQARERGCATSSLQSSALGEPVYTRLGYRPFFRFHMYERRH